MLLWWKKMKKLPKKPAKNQLEPSSSTVNNTSASLLDSEVKGNVVTANTIVNNYNNFSQNVNQVVTSFRLITTPVSNFVGREDIISKIHHQLNECSSKTRFDDRIVVLHGFGGIGKTETARKYVEKHINDPIIQNVAWIDSESEKSLKASFVSLAKILKLEIPEEDDKRDAQQIAKDVYQHFSDHIYNGLFIFDNSLQMKNPDKYFGISKYLPTQYLEKRPLILITARTSEWSIPKENIIDIQELDEEISTEFLKQKLNLTETQRQNKSMLDSIRELAFAMQGYPLGLTLAASNIDNDELNDLCTEIKKYLKRMEMPTEESKWVEDTLSEGDPNTYPLIMSSVWKATLEKIESKGKVGKEAIKALKIMAYMSPDNIKLEKVEQIFKFIFSKEIPEKSFSILLKFTLISTYKKKWYSGTMISIHRLVQHYTRTKQQEEKDNSIVIEYCIYLSQYWSRHEHLRGIFVYLQNYWPANTRTILFSILFCSGHAGKWQTNLQNSLRILFEYFQKNNGQHFMLEKEGLEENEVKLMMMSLYYYLDFRNGWFGDDLKLQDSKIDNQQIKNFPMTITKPFVEYLLQPSTIIRTENQSEVTLKPVYKIFYQMLYNRYIEFKRPFLEPFELLAEMVDSGQCGLGREGTAWRIYKLLAMYFDLTTEYAFSCETYLNLIFRIHQNVYPTVDQNSAKEMKKYWSHGGPIDYDAIPKLDSPHVVRLFEQKASMMIGVCEILEEHMNFFSVYWDGSYLPVRIMKKVEELGFPEELNSCGLFLKHFYSFFLQCVPKEDINWQACCLATFMGFFSKKKVLKDKEGTIWSIGCLAKQIKAFSAKLNAKDFKGIDMYNEMRVLEQGFFSVRHKTFIRNGKRVFKRVEFLRDFIELHENDNEHGTKAAIEIAVRILRDKDLA